MRILLPRLSLQRTGSSMTDNPSPGAIANASAAILAGYAKVVMVYKIITQPPNMRFGASYGRAARSDPRSDFHRPFGLMAPGQFFSLFFRRHMHQYGTKTTHLAEVAVALQTEGGHDAMQLRIAEQYIEQLGKFAKASTSLIVPANLTDLASMVALATKIAPAIAPAGKGGVATS